MTPAARIAAAIEVLDRNLAAMPAEKALTTWAREHRFAGSKDRAAIRDYVFDALRRRASYAMLGGGESGRALMIGALRAAGADPETVFTGEGYAPAPLTEAESGYRAPAMPDWPHSVRFDYPKWLKPELVRSLGNEFEPVMRALQSRAPVFLRTNTLRCDRRTARDRLLEEGIESEPHGLAATALEVTANAPRIRQSAAFMEGLVELQDASSQAVVELLGRPEGDNRALDFCAGGGGKALALAAMDWAVTAHDANPARMHDLPGRARRAGAEIVRLGTDRLEAAGSFELVLADAPCSGSGAWRRQAEARWTLTPDALSRLTDMQDHILDRAAERVRAGGRLAYATCSLLACENEDRLEAFCSRQPGWRRSVAQRFSPLDGGDGFFVAILEK